MAGSERAPAPRHRAGRPGGGSLAAVSPAQALAFRLAAHHLAHRVPLERLTEPAAIGMRERPPDGAALALRARVADLSPAAYDAAVEGGDLVALYAMRGAVHVVPGPDERVVTAGSLPADDAELRHALGNWAPYLGSNGVAATDALDTVTGAVASVLATRDGAEGAMTKGDISGALHGLLPPALEPMCPACRAAHVPEPLFRLAVIAAGTRVVPGRRPTTFVPAEPPPSDAGSRSAAAVELARRFLHFYAPTVPEDFATWRGFPSSATSDGFAGLRDEVAATEFQGRTAWVLSADLELLADPPTVGGVTLLPRDDPFVAQRDRATLAPARAVQRRLWTSTGSTGAVLVRGTLAALWRGRQQGRRFTVAVEPLQHISARDLGALEAEAVHYASFRGAAEAVVEIAAS